MDYEKKIREYLNSSEVDQLYKSLLSNLFPELVEPKEEKARRSLLEFLEDLFKLGKNINFDRWSKADCEEWVNWVMKQGEQKSGEWSKEDKEMITAIMCSLNGEKLERVWGKQEEDVENWFKSLKDRYTWEPNNEHYELKEFAKIVEGNLTGISKAVQKLFEAKYLQLTGNKMYGGFKD